jgi:predicted outer membrane repeat protein
MQGAIAMIGDTANRSARLVSIVVLQTREVVAGTKAALRMRATLVAAVVATLALALMFGTTAYAATIMVNSLANIGAPGVCVLRDAITAANTKTATNGCAAGDGNDMISFKVSGTIALTRTLPRVTDSNLTINGPASPGITVDGGGQVQIMVVASSATLNLNHLTIANGTTQFGAGIRNRGTLIITNSTFSGNSAVLGGAIFNRATLTVINSTFSRNSAVFGGGIYSTGTLAITNSIFSRNGANHLGSGAGIENEFGALTVTNSTFFGNIANRTGAGIDNESGTLTVTNSTFSGNRADRTGAGIGNEFGALTVTNSTFFGNSAEFAGGSGIYELDSTTSLKSTILAGSSSGINCDGTITDAGYNISDDTSCRFSATGSLNNTDPMLDPAGLTHNGGPTRTIALLSGSPAIDAIPVANCTDQARTHNPIITDQRLFPRPDSEESLCDIGAYEFADTPFIPFSRFSGSLTTNSNTRVLNLNGSFKLGRGGSIDPTTQPVAFSVGQNALRLPVGSFVQNATGYVYQKSGRSILRISIKFTNVPGSYRLLVFQHGGPLFTAPELVTLTIGNNSGSTVMNGKFS